MDDPIYLDLNKRSFVDAQGRACCDGRYLIAVGTGFCDKPDNLSKLDIVFSDGTIMLCMMGDAKSDSHTNTEPANEAHKFHVGGYDNGRYYVGDGSVIELIVDKNTYNKPQSESNLTYLGLARGTKIVKVVWVK